MPYYSCLSDMRRTFFSTLLILTLGIHTVNAFGQENLIEDSRKHKQLFYLCKVWGFLYYYHPVFAHNIILWEETLRNSIDIILNSSHSSVQSIASSLLQDLSTRTASRSLQPYSFSTLKLLPHTDFHWLQDNVFDANTQREFETIRATSLPLQSVHYISKDESSEPVIFSKTTIRNATISKTESLMSLFILWNAINYLYPHKEQCDKNWDSLLVQNIPQFLRGTTNADYLRSLLKVRSQIKDSHAFASSPDMDLIIGKYGIPARFLFLDSGVVIQESYCCDSTNIQGWIIQEINGVAIDSLINSFSSLVAASNKTVQRREIAKLLRLSHTPLASITIAHGAEKKRLVVDCLRQQRSNYLQQSQSYYRTIEISDEDTVVYFDISRLQPADVPTALNILKTIGKKGAIFDLRKYPKFIVYDIMQQLANQTTFGAMARNEFQYPGYHSMPSPLVCGKKQEYFSNVVILVNEDTQSRGEFTVQALRTIPGAKVVGSQTAGSNGEVMKVVLPMNATVYFTHNAVFDTEMKSMQGVGILPDVEVRPTIAGIRAGRDEVLEKGVEVLRKMITTKK